MRIKLIVTLVSLMSLSMVSFASGSSILYFNDYCLGSDSMAQALTNLSGTHSVTTVSSSADFAAKISSGDYDLGIFSAQNYPSSNYDDGITALGGFVAGGGHAIYTDWSRNDTYAALFGAIWTDGSNSNTFSISEPQLADGIINPLLLTNPGWGIFSMDVSGGSILATFQDGDGAIALGSNGHSITNGFLTDTFVDGAQGARLYMNEINYLLDTEPVPEPSTMLLVGIGLGGLGILARRRNR